MVYIIRQFNGLKTALKCEIWGFKIWFMIQKNKDMTTKERNKFREMLIDRKGIIDFEDDNPLVAIYFDDLVYLVEGFTFDYRDLTKRD